MTGPDPVDDPVDDYVAALATSLHGPRRAKERLLAEIGDGLREAAGAHRGPGVDLGAAVRLAIEEFGRPDELAADCQAELTVRQTRTTAFVLVLAVAGLLGCWHGLWVGAEVDAWSVAAVVVGVVPALCATLAAATLLVTGRLGRALPMPSRLPAVTAWAATASSVTMLVVSTVLLVAEVRPVVPVAACLVVTVVLHGVVAASARSCRRCSTAPRTPA